MSGFLRSLDDWLTREDPETCATVAEDADYAEAMEAIGVSDGDAADEAYHRLRAIEEFHEAQRIIHRPTL